MDTTWTDGVEPPPARPGDTRHLQSLADQPWDAEHAGRRTSKQCVWFWRNSTGSLHESTSPVSTVRSSNTLPMATVRYPTDLSICPSDLAVG